MNVCTDVFSDILLTIDMIIDAFHVNKVLNIDRFVEKAFIKAYMYYFKRQELPFWVSCNFVIGHNVCHWCTPLSID